MRSNFYLLCGLLCLLSARAFGWGKTGHSIIARIAYEQLSPEAQRNLDLCLGGMTPEQAGVWMDEKRSDQTYDFMKPWHYINVEKGRSYSPTTDENVVNKIIEAYRELSHRGTLCADQQQKDVLMLFHLIGDLHQPLHAGYAADKGGNTAHLPFEGPGTNLHALWDEGLIQKEGITLAQCKAELQAVTATSSLFVKSNRSEEPDIVGWMEESRALLPLVYNTASVHSGFNAYSKAAAPIIRKRLAQAGFRLWAVLEWLFGPDSETLTASDVRTSIANPIPVVQTVLGSSVTPAGALCPEEAAQHIGEQATVCGKVFGTKYSTASSSPTFINLGAAYPASPFTVVIFPKDRAKFPYTPEEELSGKTICVSGIIKDYKGRAEIVVTDSKQIILQ